MLQVAVLAANGKAGKLLVKEALLQGASVCAFVRGAFDMKWLENCLQSESTQNGDVKRLLENLAVVKKDIFALDSSDLAHFDVIFDAFGEWRNLSLYQKHIIHLEQILQGSKGALFIVGGAGSLYVDSHTQLVNTPSFPEAYKPLALAHSEVLKYLKESSKLQWCFVSPAAEFVPDLPKGESVQISNECFQTNTQGQSIIGYADFAYKLCQIALDSNATYARRHIGLFAE